MLWLLAGKSRVGVMLARHYAPNDLGTNLGQVVPLKNLEMKERNLTNWCHWNCGTKLLLWPPLLK
jgi:hypothetical protein